MRPDVSIVMPCLNEAESISFAILSAKQALAGLKKRNLTGEIVVVDNGSTDGSQDIARQAGCRAVHCPSRGYGNALIYGINHARGRYIVMGDADASYDFTQSVSMVEKLQEGYDLCMGSRYKGTILPGAMPWKNRFIGNPLLTKIVNLLFRSGMSDVYCGLRAFTREAYDRMKLNSSGMEFASEMVVKASLLQLKRTEVPITLSPDRRSHRSYLKPWRDGWCGLKLILRHSPLWLFFIPALAMMSFSLLIFLVLLLTPAQHMFTLGALRLGDHWMILAGGIFIIGYQVFVLGIISALYHHSQQNHYSLMDKFVKYFTLENALLLSALLIACGILVLGYVGTKWIIAAFGPLFEYRMVVIGTIFLVVGVQTFFAGFLFSVLLDDLRNQPF
ncbi:MAG: glycosyltransferase family 2 protein [Deltaproteobacteria bacterium]|nr:glycosyltransferase family 2 protein [Deltaproteobacteria bacterium]